MKGSKGTQCATVGVIAKRLKVKVHQVEYVLRTREIHPVSWAGNARVYSESDVERVQSELCRIAAEREVWDAH